MNKQNKKFLVGMISMFFLWTVLLEGTVLAGSLEPPSSAMISGNPVPTTMTPPSWDKKFQCDSSTACPRFEIVMDGVAVLDKETGLVWKKDVSPGDWAGAWVVVREACLQNLIGGRRGWRLPTIAELGSLTVGNSPMLPAGHPFTNLGTHGYWSSTEDPWAPVDEIHALYFDFNNYGNPVSGDNVGAADHGYWCVRGGNSHE